MLSCVGIFFSLLQNHAVEIISPHCCLPTCNIDRFVTEKARSEHIRRDHKKQSPATAEKLFVCEFCARPFQKMYALQAHIKNLHSEPEDTEQVQCDVCQKWMKSSHSLNAHMKRHSSGPQTCPICNKQSSNSDALKQHIKRVHEAQCTYQCHLCPKAFKFAAELKVSAYKLGDSRLIYVDLDSKQIFEFFFHGILGSYCFSQ